MQEPVERYRGYRVPSARLAGFDYGRGVFFVTIVARDRVPWFGAVAAGRVEVSWAGRVVWDEWRRTGDVRPGVTVDAFIAMPDHVHGVLAINGDGRVGGGATGNDGVETPRRGVSTGDDVAPWRPGVLGAVIGRFKSQCTRRIRARHPDFAWQSRFYDVIIRDARHLAHVRRYVHDNAAR